MVWNQPGNNNGQDRDPWGNGGGSGDKNDSNKGDNKKNSGNRPTSFLDDLMKQLSGLSKKKDGRSSSNPSYTTVIALIVIVLVLVWVGSGVYTIKEGERGVVTRFGKVQNQLVMPGLNWNPRFIDKVQPVNVSKVRDLGTSGFMLTADENLVHVEMNVQYKITNPKNFLFSVSNPIDTLHQATDSALRAVVGKYVMDKILTEGRTIVRDDTQTELVKTIELYNMGISIQDVNFQTARAPDEVKDAFDDAIKAREDEERYVSEAEAYANALLPKAKGHAAQILASADAYKEKTVLEAQGDVTRLKELLPEYKAAPNITRERLYLETMEKILSQTDKVLVDEKGQNLMVLPLDQLMKKGMLNSSQETQRSTSMSDSGSNQSQQINSMRTSMPPSINEGNLFKNNNEDILMQRAESARRTESR